MNHGKQKKADEGGTAGNAMLYGLNILDGPSSPDVLFAENTTGGLKEAEDTIGQQWRNELDQRNFAGMKRRIDSGRFSGPEERMRHYEVNSRKDCGNGAAFAADC